VDINRVWETVKVSIKISAKESLSDHELKKQRPWFDRSKLVDQRKETILQWLQGPSQINLG
jgi:hypothetical protein